MRAVPRWIRISLMAIAVVNALSAIGGGIGLMINGLGLPPEWLDGTVFTSYVVPGILLAVVIGGTQVLAALAQRAGLLLAWGLHAAAGLTMMTWIFGEIVILLEWSPLQGIYFVLGLAQAALAVLALGAWPRPFLAKATASTP